MENIFQAVIAIIFCVFLVFVISEIKRRLLQSLDTGGDTELTIVIRAAGSAPTLEQTLKSAGSMQKNSRHSAEIVIIDEGLTYEARRIAELFAKSNGCTRIEDSGGAEVWKQDSTSE